MIEELINTEREYVRDLNIMVEVFLLPLKFKKIASDVDINTLFRLKGKSYASL